MSVESAFSMWAILDENKNVVPCEYAEHAEWARDFNRKIVGSTYVDRCRVSTVFLGLNHSDYWFETLVFPHEGGGEVMGARYKTWQDAVEGHEIYVERTIQMWKAAMEKAGRKWQQ